MRPYWLFLGVLTACTRIPTDDDKTGDTGEEADADTDADADGDADADADTDADTDTDVNYDCGVPSQLGPFDDHPLLGVTTTSMRPTNDAGLAAVRAAADAVSDDTELTDPLQVTGALVTLIGGFRPSQNPDVVEVWVADSSGGMYLRFVTIPESFGLQVGDIVDFDVQVVSNFGGLGQVTNLTTGSPDFDLITEGIANLTITSSGSDVWVADAATEAPLTVGDEGHAIIEAYGRILDGGSDCGSDGERCYSLEYAKGETVTYRSSSNYVEQNDCLHYIGPLNSFNGPQIDASDFDWTRSY